MAAGKYLTPHSSVKLTDNEQRASRDWLPYLAGIEVIARRTDATGALADLGGGATLADVITRINAIQALLRAG